jgi:hypothetical protein
LTEKEDHDGHPNLHLSLDLLKQLLQLVLVCRLHRPLDTKTFLLVGFGNHVDLWRVSDTVLLSVTIKKAYRGRGRLPGGQPCRCSAGC